MIPEFYQLPDPSIHFGIWRTIIGLLIVFVGTCVGVEIRVGKDDDEI